MPLGRNFSGLDLSRISEDAGALSGLRSEICARSRLLYRRHVYQLRHCAVNHHSNCCAVVTGWWITKDVIWAVILFLPFPLSHFLPVFCGSIWIRRLIRRHADLNLARRITDLLRFSAAGYPVTYVQKYRDFELALFAAGAVPSCCSHGHAPWLAFCAH